MGQRRRRNREIVYVGMTSKSVHERLEQHRSGYLAAKIIKRVRRLGLESQLRLRPDLMELAGNSQPHQRQALKQERALARELERQGYTVHSN